MFVLLISENRTEVKSLLFITQGIRLSLAVGACSDTRGPTFSRVGQSKLARMFQNHPGPNMSSVMTSRSETCFVKKYCQFLIRQC